MLNKLKFKLREKLPKSQKVNRIIKISICFLIAALLTASIFIGVQKQNETVIVIKAKEVIEEGTQKINNSDLVEVEVSKFGLPPEAITNKAEIIGKYAKSDIYTTDYITKEKLTDKKSEPFRTIKSNKKIMSFTVPNLAASVASNINIGDKIQVMYAETVTDQTGMNSDYLTSAPECLKNLEVIDIKDANGYTKSEEKKDSSKIYTATSFIPSVITVVVNDEQATELYKAEQTKSIYTIFLDR